jgi:hypothetical protein
MTDPLQWPRTRSSDPHRIAEEHPMSVLTALDATNICSRRSDPAAWAMPVAVPTRVPVRPEPPAALPAYSWWSLARNPQALLLSGVIAAGVLRDTVARVLADGLAAQPGAA